MALSKPRRGHPDDVLRQALARYLAFGTSTTGVEHTFVMAKKELSHRQGGGEDLDLLLRIDKFSYINDFVIQGQIAHPVEQLDLNKQRVYYQARGYVLGKNKEFLLFLTNFVYDVSLFYRDGLARAALLTIGFVSGLRKSKY